ncbi:unnamed protein product, partial [Polarella glacialis]
MATELKREHISAADEINNNMAAQPCLHKELKRGMCRLSSMVNHKVFPWVLVLRGNELDDQDPNHLVELHGVPEHVILKYWQDEKASEHVVSFLPRALGLVIFFALMMV